MYQKLFTVEAMHHRCRYTTSGVSKDRQGLPPVCDDCPFCPLLGRPRRKARIRLPLSELCLVAVLGLSVFGEGGSEGPWFLVGGHSIGTTTGLLLRTILCKSLVLMPRVKFVEKYTKHGCWKVYSIRILKWHGCKITHNKHKTSFTCTHCSPESARMSKIKNGGLDQLVWHWTLRTAAIWNSWGWRG